MTGRDSAASKHGVAGHVLRVCSVVEDGCKSFMACNLAKDAAALALIVNAVRPF